MTRLFTARFGGDLAIDRSRQARGFPAAYIGGDRFTPSELENFKGIAGRQRIDFAPLTLLFGANSAGKSTILQALLYLHEVLERGSAGRWTPHWSSAATCSILGGFARLVHRHEADRSIVLRAEFATPGGLERFGRDLADFPFPDLDDEVESAWLELTIRFRISATFRGPLLDSRGHRGEWGYRAAGVDRNGGISSRRRDRFRRG